MTILSATMGAHLAIGEAASLALLGYAVVFLGIVLLMLVVMAMGRVFIARAPSKPHDIGIFSGRRA